VNKRGKNVLHTCIPVQHAVAAHPIGPNGPCQLLKYPDFTNYGPEPGF